MQYKEHKVKEVIHRGLRARLIDGTDKYIREDGVVIWKYKSKEGFKETHGSLQRDKYRSASIGGKKILVHRLVARAFIPNPDNLPIVDHIDENKQNNSVSNLRWCTNKMNSEYYHSMPGRIEKRFILQGHSDIVKNLTATITSLTIDLENAKRDFEELKVELEKVVRSKLIDKEAFESYKEAELQKIAVMNSNYKGYKSVSGSTFNSVQAMVVATGKRIIVDGITFVSAGSAATYIVTSEDSIGNTRKHSTVSKELRRFLQGKLPAWTMYGKYTIGS